MQAGSSLPWEAYVNLVHTTAKNRNLDLSKAAEAVAAYDAVQAGVDLQAVEQ